jgi:hypothetical protein
VSILAVEVTWIYHLAKCAGFKAHIHTRHRGGNGHDYLYNIIVIRYILESRYTAQTILLTRPTTGLDTIAAE